MDVYNKEKTEILIDPDLTLGYLISDYLEIKHDKIEEVLEEGHYETITEYENGGKDVEWIIDIPGVQGKEEYIEKKDIKVYIPYTQEELNIISIKSELDLIYKWFDFYDLEVVKYARNERLGIENIFKLEDLDKEAEIKSKRITEINLILKGDKNE